MLDLDRFKHVNDVLGYRFGDMLLRQVAERLSQQIVRGGDLVARLGGDEFRGAAAARRRGRSRTSVAQRIERAFDAPLTLEEHTVDMGAGIGIACWPEHAAEADLLLSHAEVAMYAAKRRTEGPLMYSASIDAASAQTLSLLTETAPTPSITASCACTCSPSSAWSAASSPAPRRWCAGATRRAASCRRWSSSRSPSRPASSAR